MSLKENKIKKGKESLVDTLGNITYPLIVGGIIDYASGLRGFGILASRSYATLINVPAGAPYGKWRNLIFKVTKTTDESSRIRQSLTDLLAFNSFQVPLYSTVIAVGSLISEGSINWEKVKHGAEYLAITSPVIAPTMGLYMDWLRKTFKLKSAPEKANVS
ncbi:MAG: L-alanine exporter AlaE [Nanoarchaeota archaeon]